MPRRSLTGSEPVTSAPSISIVPRGRLDQPVDHLQRRGLAAAGRADEDDELARARCRGRAPGRPPSRRRRSCRPRTRRIMVCAVPPIGNLHAVTLLAAAAGASASADGPTCYSRLTNEWICWPVRRGLPAGDPARHARAPRDHRAVGPPRCGHRLPAGAARPPVRPARVDDRSASPPRIYTIPSLALLPLMVPFTGLSKTTVVIGLALYALTILVRCDARGAARGAGRGRGVRDRARLRRRAGCCSGSSCRSRCR